jgi:hypothetical protein
MKSAFWRSIAVVALVAVPMMANANDATIGSETSHSAMQGATLMNTTAIFNAFPHLVVMNGNGVELDADGDGSGTGKFWYEAYDETWLNFTVGRNDLGLQGTNYMWGGNHFMGPNLFPEDLLDASPFSDAMWVNLGVARPTAGGGAWAVGILFAMGADNTEDTDSGDEVTDETSGFGAQLSWCNGEGLHVSGEFAMQSAKQENPAADPTVTDETSRMNFGFNGRYDTDSYIYQGNFVYISESDDVDEDDFSGYGAMLSAGRYVRNEVDGQATVEFGVEWLNHKLEDVDGNEDKYNTFAIPTMRVAAWQQISDRFGLMGGVDWGYAITSDEVAADAEKDSDKGSDFDWSVGLYFQPNDRVRIDAQLAEDNLDHLLSLGNQEELITYIGATVGLN